MRKENDERVIRVMEKVKLLDLEELLEELDERDVRYRATSSKRQLQSLLAQCLLSSPHHSHQTTTTARVIRHPSTARVTRKKVAQTQQPPPPPKQKRMSTKRKKSRKTIYEQQWRGRSSSSSSIQQPIAEAALATLTFASDAALWTAKTTRANYYQVRRYTDSNNLYVKDMAANVATNAYKRTRNIFKRRKSGDGEEANAKEQIWNAKWQYVTKVDQSSPHSASTYSMDDNDEKSNAASSSIPFTTTAKILTPLPPVSPQPFTKHSTISTDTTMPITTPKSPTKQKPINGFVIRPPPPPPPTNATLSSSQKYVISYPNPNQSQRRKSSSSSSSRQQSSSSSSSQQQQNKTIYSPYKTNNNDEEYYNDFLNNVEKASRRVINALGTQIDNVIDLGIVTTDDDDPPPPTTLDFTNKVTETTTTIKKKKHHRRYWRDRLSQRFDKLLGLHESSKYYNSWQTQLENMEHNHPTTNTRTKRKSVNAFDIARGVPLETHNQIHKRRNMEEDDFFKTPFWEQDGSVMNLLFGRRRNGRGKVTIKDLLQKSDKHHNNIVTTLLQSLIRSMVILTAYTCKWASVRGALPQPIVVLGISTAALCAPKRKRILTIIMTLVSLRTLGEALHGYVYGNEDWEDDVLEYEE